MNEEWPECGCYSPTPLIHAIWCPVYWHMKKLDEQDAEETRAGLSAESKGEE